MRDKGAGTIKYLLSRGRDRHRSDFDAKSTENVDFEGFRGAAGSHIKKKSTLRVALNNSFGPAGSIIINSFWKGAGRQAYSTVVQ